ncbi:hypothetical protein DUNSADRAFT_13951 [Dunaliella salina]|uniref:B box-type domain-containing protein n=1 Tax=Dunaliella salina TaxID=3046 RepID=A0ABQ7G8B4_DUNSA|nr:hypothetical protein DUNSADRAFT_13951 [Dunaliella salina]|eukprot:KAF5830850.1 hypothetical protein DUNSADRAFT_13951 [Dunaliella salina]
MATKASCLMCEHACLCADCRRVASSSLKRWQSQKQTSRLDTSSWALCWRAKLVSLTPRRTTVLQQ